MWGSGLLSLFNFLERFHFLQFFSDKKIEKLEKKSLLEGALNFFTPIATSKFGFLQTTLSLKRCLQ